MKKRYLFFNWGKETYALELRRVQSIISGVDLVKTNTKEIKVCLYNKKTLPVLDAITFYSIRETEFTSKTRVIVVQEQNYKFGLLVDEIQTVESVNDEDIKEADMYEKRFVTNVIGKAKLIDLSYFLTKKTAKWIVQATSIPTKVFATTPSSLATTQRLVSKQNLIEDIKLEVMNALVRANLKEENGVHSDELNKIYQMINHI